MLFFAAALAAACLSAAAQGFNGVITSTPTIGLIADDFVFGQGRRASMTYFDGLGREQGTMRWSFGGDQLLDVVDRIDYDCLGRVCRRWLPATLHDTLIGGQLSLVPALVASTYPGEKQPYAEITYEATLDQRPVSETGPGEAWHTHSRRWRQLFNGPVKYVDTTLNAARYDLECRRFSVEHDGTLAANGKYAPHTLRVSLELDENDVAVAKFTNKAGHTVLERRYDSEGSSAGDTYYVRDCYGRLCYVLTPEASRRVVANSGPIANSIVDNYCYSYCYDSRDRLTARRLPGCAAELYVYDRLGRQVMSQNGEQRKRGEWTMKAWNHGGHLALEGRANYPNVAQSALQHEMDSTLLTAVYDPSLMMEACMCYRFDHGHPFTPCRAYYYTDYDFWNGLDSLPASTLVPGTIASTASSTNRVTGTAVTDFSGNVILTAHVYDNRGRLIKVFERDLYGQNHCMMSHVKLSWTGEVLRRRRVTCQLEERRPIKRHEERWRLWVDCWGRPSETHYWVDGGPWVTLTRNTYDQLGRLATSHNDAAGVTSYAYNLRGWLTSLQGPRFAMHLHYADGFYSSKPDYTGRVAAIGEQRLRDGVPTEQSRRFTYDAAGRIMAVDDTEPQCFNARYHYDRNGNVTRISRGSSAAPYDDIHISYRGNQIDDVADESRNDAQLGHIPQLVAGDYPGAVAYDSCGRIIRDQSHDVTKIAYNDLGLTQMVKMGTGDRVDFSYSSDGIKRSMLTSHFYTVTVKRYDRETGDTIVENRRKVLSSRRRYFGNVVVEAGKPDRIYNDYGYSDVASDSVARYYYVRDYLGSVRLVLDQNGKVVQATDYTASGIPVEALAEPAADSRLYCGKDWVGFQGLSLYYNHARLYDPLLMRFTTQDPMAEKYYATSPYLYCAGNPVSLLDPDGTIIVFRENGKQYFYQDGSQGAGFYDREGNRYGGKTAFVDSLTSALGQLRSGEIGNFLVSKLMESSVGVSVEFDDRNITRGAKVWWNPYEQSSGPVADGECSREAFIGLGHELAHVLDNINKTKSAGVWFYTYDNERNRVGISNQEKYAVTWENLIRGEHGVAPRTHYESSPDGFLNEDSRLLDQNGNNLFFDVEKSYDRNNVLNGVKLIPKVVMP